MILKQLPQPIKEKGKSDKVKTFLQIVFHINVPIFINPINKDIKYDLHISKVDLDRRKVVFHVENTGDDQVILTKRLIKYILPGSQFDITITKDEKVKDN